MCVDARAHACELTLHGECDWLTGFVLPILVIDCLSVVTARIRCHGGEDDQRVIQGDGTEEVIMREV